MKLSDILQRTDLLDVRGPLDIDIKGIQIDSRKVGPGDLFIAVRGTQADGHAFIPKALVQGAAAVMQCDAISADEIGRAHV